MAAAIAAAAAIKRCTGTKMRSCAPCACIVREVEAGLSVVCAGYVCYCACSSREDRERRRGKYFDPLERRRPLCLNGLVRCVAQQSCTGSWSSAASCFAGSTSSWRCRRCRTHRLPTVLPRAIAQDTARGTAIEGDRARPSARAVGRRHAGGR